MQNKRIVFVEKNNAQLLDDALIEPQENQVLVELAVSTISSGTERANLTGDESVNPTKPAEPAKFPRYSGYSSSGTVIKAGSAVTELAVGDRVAVSWGSHRRYVTTTADKLTKITDDRITFEEAALWHIATFPLAAIRKCRLEIGESAIVMGLGVLGRVAVQLLRIAGAAPVIAVDPVKEKREQARAFGADFAFDPFDPAFTEKVRQATNGGVNVAIEVTGNGKALDQVLDCMARFGRVALLGCTRSSDFTIDYYHKVHGKGVSLIGAHTAARPVHDTSSGLWTTHDDVMTAMRLIHLGRLNLEELVEEIHSPVDAPEVYKRLATEPSFPVVQFDWTKISVEE